MEYKWYDIRKQIVNACKKTFNEQGVTLSDADIELATDLFDRVVSYPLHFPAVGNLQAELQQSLQRSYIDQVGSSVDLRNVLTILS